MRILYINYVDPGKQNSGSSVRPYKMLEAFKETGHEIITLIGNQMQPARKKNVKKIVELINEKKPDLCYIESPTHPIYRRCDRNLIRQLHQMHVPIGYFYRDFYLKFRKDFPRRTSSLCNYLKDVFWDYSQSVTDKLLYNCDIIYIPSEKCKYLFDYPDMRPLPPAGNNMLPSKPNYCHTCIYVGGWKGHYDSHFLMDAFSELHHIDPSYNLILVVRKEEWEIFEHPSKNADWVEVHHTSGEGLIPLYRRASIGLIVPGLAYKYSGFAISVKTFEYMGFGLPIVTLRGTAMGEFVEKEQIGIATEHTTAAFAKAILQITRDSQTYLDYSNKVEKSLSEKNMWKHRALQVIKELTDNKS